MLQRPHLGCLLAFAACATTTTSIEQSWRAPTVRPGALQTVAALYVTTDPLMRRSVEDAMAQKLATSGVRTAPAYRVLTDEDLRNRERAKAKLAAAGFDGVVVIRIVGTDRDVDVVQGPFDGYSGSAWPVTYDRGYLIEETVVRIETSAYSLPDATLVWSARSRTTDPTTTRDVIDEVTSLVAGELARQQIVARSLVARARS